MTSLGFYGPEGEPLPGRVPVQVRFFGGGNRDEALGKARGIIQSFLDGARLSLANHLTRRVNLPGGGYVSMSIIQGVAEIELYAEGGAPEVLPFYGGILIKVVYYPDETAFFRYFTTPTQFRAVPATNFPEIASSGETAVLSGRPAVPGTADEAVTDWLVVQISRDKPPVEGASIASGAVSIYRIGSPLVGTTIEVRDEPDAYLLSTQIISNVAQDFYLCGKKVLSIPPLTIPGPEQATGSVFFRLYTVGMVFDSFETADEAEGIVILGSHRGLFVINTLDRPEGGVASWIQLAVGEPLTAGTLVNPMGDIMSEAADGRGGLIVSCTGSNGWGVCSGFQVAIATAPGAPPTFTGSLSVMRRASLPAVPTSSAKWKQITKTVVGGDAYTQNIRVGTDFGPPVPEPVMADVNFAYTPSSSYSIESFESYAPGTPAQTPDRLTGAYPPLPATKSFTVTSLGSFQLAAERWVEEPVEGDPDDSSWPRRWTTPYVTMQSLSVSASFTAGEYSGTLTKSATTTSVQSWETSEFNHTTGGVSVPHQTFLPASPNNYLYLAFDVLGRLWWKRTSERSATSTESQQTDWSDGIPYSAMTEMFHNDGASLGGNQSVVSYGPHFTKFELVDINGVLADVDLWADLPSAPYWRAGGVLTQAVNMGFDLDKPDWGAGPRFTQATTLQHTTNYTVQQYAGIIGGLDLSMESLYNGADDFPFGPTPPEISFEEWYALNPNSFSATFTGQFSATMSINDFRDAVPGSEYATFPINTTGDPKRALIPGVEVGGSNGEALYPQTIRMTNGGGILVSVLPATEVARDSAYGMSRTPYVSEGSVLRDWRTNGYIATIDLSSVVTTTDGYFPAKRAIIGNDLGSIPLDDVIHEWRALGTKDTDLDEKRVFVPYILPFQGTLI